MTESEKLARKQQLINEERKNPPGWWYISFADDDGFLGGVIVQGQGFITAIDRTWRLGINPGGQAQGAELLEEAVSKLPVAARERLLSKAELEHHFGPLERWE